MATTLVKNLGVQKIKPKQPVALFTGDPLEITDSWQDLSEPINVKGAKSVVIWLDYDQNSSTDTQVKALVGDTESTCSYHFSIETVSTTKVDVQDEVVEIEDADLKFVRQFILDGAVNFIKFQIKDSADGTGQIDAAKISVGLW